MNSDDLHSLSGAYAVDAVDDVERALFEAHLTHCPQCQAEVASLGGAATELTSLSKTAPPASLRTAVLRDIRAVRPLPPQMTAGAAGPEVPPSASSPLTTPARLDSKRAERARRSPRRWLAGVAAAAVLVTGGLTWHPWSSDRSAVQLTAMQQILQARDVQRFETRVGRATATVLRSASLNRAVITTANLPAAPRGKVYELWLQQGQTMVKAGFMPGGPSSTVVLQGDVANAASAGITLEPIGGSLVPSLPPVALINFA